MNFGVRTIINVSSEADFSASQRYVERTLEFPDGSFHTVQLKAIYWQIYDEVAATGMSAMEMTSIPFKEACRVHSGFYGPRTNSFAEELMLCFIAAIQAWWPVLPSHDMVAANILADADFHREQGCTRLLVVSD